MNNLKSFQDFRNEISIIELALSVGYKIKKKDGIKWPVLRHEISGDKIIIVNPKSTSNQGYFNPSDGKDKGTLINFVKNRIGSIFPFNNNKSVAGNINGILYDYQNLPSPQKKLFKADEKNVLQEYELKEFHIPEGTTKLEDPTYLYYRGLQKGIINNCLFDGKIFNVKYNGFQNIGFPYYDAAGAIVGFELRNKHFKYVVEGSDRSQGLWHSKIPKSPELVLLTESPIDALSYHQLKGKENSVYFSFGGSVALGQIETIKTIIANVKPPVDLKIIAAVDNDKMGRIYSAKFKEAFKGKIIEDFPVLNDYNEDLKQVNIAIKR